MQDLKTILLVEGNPNDVELTLAALAGYRLANDIVVVHQKAGLFLGGAERAPACFRPLPKFRGVNPK